MGIITFFFFFFFILLVAILSCNAHSEFETGNPIRLGPNPKETKINCQSFRVGVEANNIRNWGTPPSHCRSYIKSYYAGKQYGLDIEAMVTQAVDFAKSTPLPKDLRANAWVFDLDDTLISNLDFFKSSNDQGTNLPEELYEWIASENSTAPALAGIKTLYDAVLSLNYKTVIISESPESLSTKRVSDLQKAGYENWDTIIFKGKEDNELTSEEFKAKTVRWLMLSEKRYRVIATVGDQWTDLSIPDAGRRTFKVPNPLYYVA